MGERNIEGCHLFEARPKRLSLLALAIVAWLQTFYALSTDYSSPLAGEEAGKIL